MRPNTSSGFSQKRKKDVCLLSFLGSTVWMNNKIFVFFANSIQPLFWHNHCAELGRLR